MNRLECGLEFFETLLNLGCILPGLNTFNGISKTLLGTTQITAAVALALFTSPICWTRTGGNIQFHCAKHIVHGIGNVVSGLVLSVPILGNYLMIREYAMHEGPHAWNYFSHSFDWAHYNTLRYKYIHTPNYRYDPSYWFEKAKEW